MRSAALFPIAWSLAEMHGQLTLFDTFRAFAECEGEEALRLLHDRLSFFHQAPTEEHVRQLPEHAARNEQEQACLGAASVDSKSAQPERASRLLPCFRGSRPLHLA
jgi:hypothetical protein